jgi:glycosyltransferase involved in cell wall biosynthesis
MPCRLVQISFGDGFAGSATIAILSSELLSKFNYDITLVVSKNSLTEKRAKERGVNVVNVDTTRNFKNIFKDIDQLYLKIKPQVIISHHSLDRKMGMKLRRKYGKEFINIGYRHNITKSAPIIGPFIYNRYFDFLIACSKGVADSLISSGIKKDIVKVIYNGISVPDNIDEVSGKQIREKYEIDKSIVLGLSTWFHKERKGFDILFRSFAELDDSYVLFLVGIPESKQQEVLDYATEFKISKERIIMPGYVDNIWEYYKAMDIFLLPSRSEGFSLALLEAAAAKLPIIASNIPGTNEFISNEVNGILFDINYPDKLVEAIRMLAHNDSVRQNFSQKASDQVLNNFTHQNYVSNLNSFLQDAIERA